MQDHQQKILILSPIVPYTYLRICFSNRILALNQSLHKIRISWFYIVKILFGGEKGDFIYLLINAYIALITQLYVQYFQVVVTLKVWDLIRFYLWWLWEKYFIEILTRVCYVAHVYCLMTPSYRKKKHDLHHCDSVHTSPVAFEKKQRYFYG